VTRHNRLVKFSLVVALATATLWPADLFAGQRQRSGTRSTARAGVATRPRYYRPYYYRPYYYRPYYYSSFYPGYYGFYGSGFYNPYFWRSSGFGYGYGYGQYPYPPYYGPYYDNTGSARLQVTPRNTQVYIDGYFVGVVDNFDGNLQRLNVEAGEHELQLYLEGHRTFTQKVLFGRGTTLKILHAMQPLGPGESAGLPPKPDESTRAARPSRAPAGDPQGPPSRAVRPSEFGSLLLRVRPSDADILVDGEEWNAPEGDDQFVIELAEGPHRIEVRKGGFQSYTTTVRVRRGESVRLNVSLTSGGLTGAF
jgi:PEGA domain